MRKMKKKNINLYEQYMKTAEKATKKKLSHKTLGIIGAVSGLALLAGIYVILSLQLKSVQDTYDELYYNIYSDEATEQSVNVERLNYENQILQLISQKFQNNLNSISTQNRDTQNLTPELIEKILSCQSEETKIKNISYDQGIVFMSGEANDASNASGFVSRLDETGLFSYISYSGYTRQGNVYAFSATGYFDSGDSSDNNSSTDLYDEESNSEEDSEYSGDEYSEEYEEGESD